MQPNEAKARIKINKLLEESGWRFFDDGAIKMAGAMYNLETGVVDFFAG
jgi:hypothetical protein